MNENTAGAVTAIRFGGYQKPASIHNRAAAHFGELLRRRIGPAVDFRLIGSVLDELGRPSGDLPRMVESGELSLCYMSTVRFSGIARELGVLELPFVVKDRASAYRAFDGEFGRYAARRVRENSGFRLLGIWDNGFRHISNSVRPIRRPEDCRGLVIRTQMSELHGETFRALGFDPVAVDIKEFTESIGTGRFHAQDNPLTNIYNFGVHRFQRYITLTGHFYGASAMICNGAHYESWPAGVRAAVDAAAAEATAFQRRLAAAEDAAMMAKLGAEDVEIVELTGAERAAFTAALQPVIERHRGDFDAKLFAVLGGR
ncbi:MAG: TRAP transporter substrate-binding protein DctP [Burkholderiales bacterium]|nr:TRAP transporter substrate-binding protein DctP [Burkholderiales bacterium]